jgi:hypothetical protein
MDEVTGSFQRFNEYEELREALVKLRENKISSEKILHDTEKKYTPREAHNQNKSNQPKLDLPKRSALDKFTSKKTIRIKNTDAYLIWECIKSTPKYAEICGLSTIKRKHAEHALFYEFAVFYGIRKEKIEKNGKSLGGKYTCYQYSEYFNDFDKKLPCAVVVGELNINHDPEKGVINVAGKQEYDGALGLAPMTETYKGYCFPKGDKVYLVMQNESSEQKPQFYIFYQMRREGGRVTWMKGHVLAESSRGEYFHSPVYAVREKGEVECNIKRCSDLNPNILSSLRENTMKRANPGLTKGIRA